MINPFEQSEYRASELGACIKRLVAHRMGISKREGVPASMQAAFDRGNAHEVACLATMHSEGWDVWGEQEELVTPIRVGTNNLSISGHPDCMTRPPWVHETMSFVGEIKSPTAWQMFVDECYDPSCSALTEHYRWQLSFYMVCKRAQGMMICLDTDFKLQYRVYEEPFYTWEDIVERVNTIEAMAKAKDLPKLCNIRDFPCPYFHLHDDIQEFTEDTVLDEFVARWSRAQDRKKDIDKEISYVRRMIHEHMGDDTEKTTPSSRVTVGSRKVTKYDYARMRKDGIPVDDYKTVTESEPYPTITYKGESGD